MMTLLITHGPELSRNGFTSGNGSDRYHVEGDLVQAMGWGDLIPVDLLSPKGGIIV